MLSLWWISRTEPSYGSSVSNKRPMVSRLRFQSAKHKGSCHNTPARGFLKRLSIFSFAGALSAKARLFREGGGRQSVPCKLNEVWQVC